MRCRRSKASPSQAVLRCAIESTRCFASSSRVVRSSSPTARSAISYLPGRYLLRGRRFNDAVDDYCGLLGLPAGLIDNVTDGTNAFLVALERDRGVLVSEAEIVDAKQQNRISDVFLDRPAACPKTIARRWRSCRKSSASTWLEERSRAMPLNPRLRERIAAADLIIYAPGTQHSSLFPSYLTKDLSRAIASNLTAIKLLVTNIQADAEISGSTAVDIVERAVYYLKEKGKLPLPVPTLITHYIINDPKILESDADAGYVPLGHLETFEDPRLVRIGHYEDGVSGRHDASKVLTPFLQSFLSQRRRQRIAVWLYDAASLNKLSQSVLEMLRGGIQDLAVDVTVFYTRRRRPRRCVHAAAADHAAESASWIRGARQGIREGLDRARVRLRGDVRVLWHVPRRRPRESASRR